MSIWQKIKAFFIANNGSTIVEQFKEIIEEEKTIAKNLEASVEAEVKVINDQITDAVTQAKAVVKKPRKKK